MTEADYKELKKGGFMKQIQKDCFSLRIKLVGGQLGAKELQKIQEVAEKFGHGYIHLTSRQSIEIPFVKLADVDAVKASLAEAGLQPGACGPRVRTVTACQGNSICPSGMINTTELALEFDERHAGKELPHKFKLGITGCKNNCLKAEENDLGVKGGLKPNWQKEQCSFCGLCEAVCPTKAITINKEENQLAFKEADCVYCGKCVKSCPADAWQGKNGYILYFGGTFGNDIAPGKQVLPLLFTKADVHKATELAMSFFKQYGKQGERFRKAIDRVGWDIFEKDLKEGMQNE